MADFAKMIEEIKGMTVLELSELVKALEEEFGVSAAAPVAVAGGADAGAVVEEQTEFNLILVDAGAEKLKVVRTVKDLTGASLKEAKDMCDNVPSTLKEGISKDEAEGIKTQIEAAGGKVEIK